METITAVDELEKWLMDISAETEWDHRSLLEFTLHFYDWNDELNENTMLDINIFPNDMEFITWYFEDLSTQLLIEKIIECETMNDLTQECMNEATTKLSNGAIVRCLI